MFHSIEFLSIISSFKLFIFLSVLVMDIAGAGVSTAQVSGLEYLYNSTGGDQWAWSSSTGIWNFNSDENPCLVPWEGILCNNLCSNTTDCTIVSLKLQYFNLIGTIPDEISQLTGLEYFSLGHNSLYGGVPSSLGTMVSMLSMELDSNQLNQTIPTALGSLTLLQNLYLRENMLVGEIPSSLANLPLFNLYLDRNSLTSTIPTVLGDITSLGLLYLHDNSLSGEVPTSFANLLQMSFLSLSNNGLRGRVDEAVPTSLSNIYMNSNMFTGGFPAVFLNCPGLVLLDIGRNSFEGKLPSAIQSMTSLKYVIAGSNRFTGDINDVFTDVDFVNQLIAIDLTENGFSGSLPDVLFSSQSLEVIALSKNCFVGQLTDSICNAGNLTALSLSGLTAGEPCVIAYTSLGADFTTVDPLKGTIPACIFSLPRLESVYIAGNGIEGELAGLPANSTMVNMSLAYNRLHGSIPMSVQRDNKLLSLNLAFNRFIGTVEELAIGSSNNVFLETNRLSGDLPRSLAAATDVDILTGNIFQCLDRTAMPENDPKVSNYICGSETLDVYSFAYCGVFVVAAMIAYYGYLIVKKLTTRDENKYPNFFEVLSDFAKISWKYLWYTEADIAHHEEVDQFAYYCHKFRKSCFLVAVMIVLVLLPVYMLFKFVGFATYTYQYGWLPSIAYLHHPTAALILSCLIVVFMRYAYRFHHEDEVIMKIHEQRESITLLRSKSVMARRDNYPYIIGWFVVNVVVVLVANGFYVYALLKTTAVVQVILTLVVVAFKLGWNSSFIIPKLDMLEGSLNVLLLAAACNSVVFPVFATMFVDIDCFQSLFITTPNISASFMVPSYLCLKFNAAGDCMGILPYIGAVSFTAPYTYSDQCSSSMLTKYIPVYILIYGMVYTVVSVLQVVVMLYFGPLYKCPNLENDYRKSPVPVPGAVDEEEQQQQSGIQYNNEEHVRKIAQLESIWRNIDLWDTLTAGIVCRMTIPIQGPENMMKVPGITFYYMKYRLLNYLMTLMLLVTFGLAYPPLAVVLVVCLVLQTIITQVCIHLHREQMRLMPKLYHQWHDIFTEEVLLTGKILFGRRPFIYVFAVLFISFFLVDNTINTNYAAAIAIPFVLCTVMIVVLYNPMKNSVMRLAEESRDVLNQLAKLAELNRATDDAADVELSGVSATRAQEDSADVNLCSVDNPIQGSNNSLKNQDRNQNEVF